MGLEQYEFLGDKMTLQEIIDSSNNIVFFGGAGVSTESGIPDFRLLTGFIIKYMNILPRKFFHMISFGTAPIIFIAFIAIS